MLTRIPEASQVNVLKLDLLIQDQYVLAQIGDRVIVRCVALLEAPHGVCQCCPRMRGCFPGPLKLRGQP